MPRASSSQPSWRASSSEEGGWQGPGREDLDRAMASGERLAQKPSQGNTRREPGTLSPAATVKDNSSGHDVERKPVGAEQEACERVDEVELLEAEREANTPTFTGIGLNNISLITLDPYIIRLRPENRGLGSGAPRPTQLQARRMSNYTFSNCLMFVGPCN